MSPFRTTTSGKGPRGPRGPPLGGCGALSRAGVIGGVEAGLFGGGDPLVIKYARDFAGRRRLDDAAAEMNRLFVVESVGSITGACADHRRAVRASAVPALAAQLAGALGTAAPATVAGGAARACL